MQATPVGFSMHRADGDDRVLELIGEIDVATSPLLRSALSELLDGAPRVQPSTSRRSPSSTRRAWACSSARSSAARESRPDAVLRVANVQGVVRNVFDITGLDELFELT